MSDRPSDAVLTAPEPAPAPDARDTGYAPPAWTFDAEVARVFDDMLERSIPEYGVMRRLCYDVGASYVRPGTDVVDLGCARGGALIAFADRFGRDNRYVGVDVSEPMLAAASARFRELVADGIAEIVACDLRTEYPDVRAGLTLAVLTLQFVPIEYRQAIVRRIYRHTAPGGAFVLVEKVLGATAEVDERLVETYYALKRRNGYSQDEIDRKRFALEGRLVPVTARWNEELLSAAGFREVHCFWRYANFAGWLAVRADDRDGAGGA